MMKIWIRWYVCLLSLMAVGFGLVSCSENDDEEEIEVLQPSVDNKDDGNKDEEGDVPEDGGSDNPVSEINGMSMEYPITGFSDESMYQTYSYNPKGWLTGFSVHDTYEGITYTCDISYTMSTITTSYSDGDAICHNIRLNGKGFIASFDYRCEWDDETDNGIDDGKDDGGGYVSYEYDDDGHLVAERGRQDYEGEPAGNWIIKYTWRGGNLTKVDTNVEYDDGHNYQEVVEYTYDADKYPNSGVFFNEDFQHGSWFMEFSCYYYSGLFGRPAKNIPVGIVCYDEGFPARMYSTTFVGYNEDGTINTISFDDGMDKESFHYGYAKYPLLYSEILKPEGAKHLYRNMRMCRSR